MAAIVVTSEDVGAPALTNTGASFYAVLKWAIPQLGWTIAFDNGVDIIVFRNDPVDGNGVYLRVDCTTSTEYATVKLYETMSDIDTGTFPTIATDVCYWHFFYDAGTPPWKFIGDKHFFWIYINTRDGYPSISQLYCAGDAISRVPLARDAVISYAEGALPTVAVDAFLSGANSTSGERYIAFMKNLAGDAAGTYGNGFAVNPVGQIDGSIYGTDASGNTQDPITGESYFCRCWLTMYDEQVIRARLPGTYIPIGDWQTPYDMRFGNSFVTVPALSTPEGIRDLWLVKCGRGRGDNVPQALFLIDPNSEDWDNG